MVTGNARHPYIEASIAPENVKHGAESHLVTTVASYPTTETRVVYVANLCNHNMKTRKVSPAQRCTFLRLDCDLQRNQHIVKTANVQAHCTNTEPNMCPRNLKKMHFHSRLAWTVCVQEERFGWMKFGSSQNPTALRIPIEGVCLRCKI